MSTDESTITQLMIKFYSYKFVTGGNLESYAQGLVLLDAELRDRGVFKSDDELRMKLIGGIPLEYEVISSKLTDSPHMTFVNVVNYLTAQSQKRAALRALARGNSAEGKTKRRDHAGGQQPGQRNPGALEDRKCHLCQLPGHYARQCPTRPKPPPKSCFICKDPGHMATTCPLIEKFHHYLKIIRPT